jgi:hypothetical protein
VNDQVVEVLAKRLYEQVGRSPLAGARSWSQLGSGQQRTWRNDARSHLAAITPLLALEVRERLLDALEKARQGHVRPGCVNGDLFGNLHDKDHAKADLAERRVISGVQVVALADVNAAIDAALDTPAPSEPEEG